MSVSTPFCAHRLVRALSVLLVALCAVGCTRSDDDEPETTAGQRPTDGSVTATSSDVTNEEESADVYVTYEYSEYFHRFQIRSTLALTYPDDDIQYGVQHVKDVYSFGASQFLENYNEHFEGDTLVANITVPFWTGFAHILNNRNAQWNCEDAYEAGDYATLSAYEPQLTGIYTPAPYARLTSKTTGTIRDLDLTPNILP